MHICTINYIHKLHRLVEHTQECIIKYDAITRASFIIMVSTCTVNTKKYSF